ncbi:tRNA (adenosine(37)-N6)-threonylcarbamoyltransferase complex dimerization subunit type 1 TsaB [bacterium]|nr:tRNA (adenosine(37)-N6)-threonylcarbamoyltransferase complex dimerization subunit type 1 TsaB [bacterium]|tara:strand:- start:8125 stop:8787 length:663 start_codon:yes stop_codon:yes gene_type:complete
MSLNLIINTAIDPFGFSLEKDGRNLVSIKQCADRCFSETLVSKIDYYCRLYHHGLADINGIGVINGPGSYTGIRIGVSYAKTLAFSLDCSVVGMSSLEALANQCGSHHCVFAIILSAKPNYVYFQLFNTVDEVRSISDLLLLTYEDCKTLLASFYSCLAVYVSSKSDIFNHFSSCYISLYPIDIDCSKLFPLLHQKLFETKKLSFRDVTLNYICKPMIGS